MGLCKDCAWWDYHQVKAPSPEGSPMRHCRNYHMHAEYYHHLEEHIHGVAVAGLNGSNPAGSVVLLFGPRFGCVHFELRKCTHRRKKRVGNTPS